MLDFTFHKYHEICKAIIASNYNPITIKDYLIKSTNPGDRYDNPSPRR